MTEDEKELHRRRSIYLLPNLFTTAGLFFGFYAIVAAMKGLYEHAAIAIYIGMIFDGLDGRVARMTNTQSDFGAQYDSISDMVTFGLAPALVVYNWSLMELGKIGWLAAFVYAAATALRLARFNTQIGEGDKRYFTGLPCPAAAAVVAGIVWVSPEFGNLDKYINQIMGMVALTIGLLMVSNIKFYSFKEVDFKSNVPFVSVLAVVFIIILIASDPPKVLCLIFLLYALSGPFMWLINYFPLRKKNSKLKK